MTGVELFRRTLDVLDWPFVTRELAAHARTVAGARLAADVPLARDIATISQSLDAVEEVLALADAGAGAPPVGGVEDLQDVVRRASRGEVLDLTELRAARSTLGALTDLRGYVRDNREAAPTLARLGAPIELDRALCTTFHAALDERGELSERTYPHLGELRRRIASLERRVRALMEDLLGSAEYEDHLQDRYVTIRADRFVLPIKAHAKGMGLGIVHDASRTGQTVFLEPHQVVPLNNDRRIAETQLIAEERRIRAELSALLGQHAERVLAGLAAATILDLACARADFARRLDATRPDVGDDGEVRLLSARHPVLVLRRQPVVANDLSLSRDRPVLVLTGPNAGGKTVALKTIGLCALLVRAGCFVPAMSGSRVDLFRDVVADIGDQQTVHEGLSSFSAHLTTLKQMIELAGASTLLLLDEIAAGTDPTQGGVLARALIERFADLGARVVATTHYAQVKAMSAGDTRVELAALEYRDGVPTYRVVPGMAGESHALGAALRVGIPEDLVVRARALMDEGERALQDAVVALETERARNEDLSKRAADALAAASARERAVAEREARIKQHAREIELQESHAFVERLRGAEREIRRIVAELQRTPTPERASAARSAVRELGATAALPEEPNKTLREIAPGDRVRVRGLGITGEVISMRDGDIEVRAGAMTMRLRVEEVEALIEASHAPAPRALRYGAGSPSVKASLDTAIRVPGNTLDLRGVRVEEGLAKLESFLDDSMLKNLDTVFVLHGHGTGALKSAIRAALARSPYVTASGPATEDQGGDAFTVARLRD